MSWHRKLAAGRRLNAGELRGPRDSAGAQGSAMLRGALFLLSVGVIAGCASKEEHDDGGWQAMGELPAGAFPDGEHSAIPDANAAVSAGVQGKPVASRGATAERELLPIPPANAFVAGEGGATVDRSAAVIVAGDMRLEIRENSSKVSQVISIRTMTPDQVERELPAGLIVGAASGTPHEPRLVPVAHWTIPLAYQMPPRTVLEVLGWNPFLNSWAVLGDATVSSDGTKAVFLTMILGDVVLRAKPVRDPAVQALCEGNNFRFKEEWPSDEPNSVGLTPQEERVTRANAFAYLADYRLHPAGENVSFKNEETAGAWHRNAVAGQSYRDEDFLMDPNAEAALTVLQDLVAREWYDPYTGESVTQLRLTEAFDSMVEHSRLSTHYQGRGIDLTLTPVPAPGAQNRRFWYGRLARLSVCAGFDYVFYENNLHVHASVHPSKVAVLVRGDDGRFGVLVGDLAAPDRWVLHPVRWTADELAATSIAWTGWRTIEVRGDGGAPALVLHADDASQERRGASPDAGLRATQTGLQGLRVVDGALYYVNRVDAPRLGSGDELSNLQRVPAFTSVPLEGWTVVDAVFRPHDRTRESWVTYRGASEAAR